MPYTEDQHLILSQLSYINLEDLESGGRSVSIAEMYDRVREDSTMLPDSAGNISRLQMLDILKAAANDPVLGDMRLVAHTNQNVENGVQNGSGLVVYVFELPDGSDRIFAFRGSEDGPASGNEDWIDNFGIVGGDSRQNREAIAYAEKINQERPPANNYATGHSLGGSNALAVAGAFGWGGAVFDARGVAPKIVNEYKKKGIDFQKNLDDNGFQSIRAEGDVVSSLDQFTWHPKNEEIIAAGVFYDENGNPIMPVPAELVGKVYAFYNDLEKFAYADPILRRIISDIILNDLIDKAMSGDLLSILKTLGYSIYVRDRLPGKLVDLAALLYKHKDAVQYLFATQDGASYPNIFTPHYTQALQSPNRNLSGNRCKYSFDYNQLNSGGDGFASSAKTMIGLSDRLKRVSNGMDWDKAALSAYKTHVVSAASSVYEMANKLQRCADAAKDISNILLTAEREALGGVRSIQL